jgi:hypothetical protein
MSIRYLGPRVSNLDSRIGVYVYEGRVQVASWS